MASVKETRSISDRPQLDLSSVCGRHKKCIVLDFAKYSCLKYACWINYLYFLTYNIFYRAFKYNRDL